VFVDFRRRGAGGHVSTHRRKHPADRVCDQSPPVSLDERLSILMSQQSVH
jgi:hypothetical protein